MSATSIIAPAPDGEVVEALSRIRPFKDLPPAVLDLLSKNSDRRRYASGQTVFSLGQYDGSEFYVVLTGRLRVSLIDSETGAMVIEDYASDSIFGLEVALAKSGADACQHLAVTAEESLELIAVDAASFRQIAADRPTLMRSIAAYFASELASLRFKTIAAQTAPEQRVFAALLEYVERDPLSGEWRIGKMPKHRELADRAGVDEPATASAVATLIQEGVAQRDYPGLVINDMKRLNQLAS